MNKKPIFYSNKQERKNINDFSPHAIKKPELFRRPALKPQASAYMKKRNNEIRVKRLQSPQQSREKRVVKKINGERHILNEDQIRNSAIYKMLQQQIRELTQMQVEELDKLRKVRNEKRQEIEKANSMQYQTKLDIWECKKDIVELKEFIEAEKEETDRLKKEIGQEDDANDHSLPVENQTGRFYEAEQIHPVDHEL